MTTGLPIRRRLTLLGFLAIAGAITFVPFLSASAPSPPPGTGLVAFVAISSVLSVTGAWFGLRWADQTELPMPLLRAFEAGSMVRPAPAGLARAIGIGVLVGGSGIAILRLAGVAGGAGSVPVRVASAIFAAVTLELVLHLAIMSGVVKWTRGRIGAGIAAATVAYLAFHLSTLGGQPAGVVAAAVVGNGLAGVLFGWLYARDGFEFLVMAHLIAHAITVGLG